MTDLIFNMARWEGVEPPTLWFVARYSIQLSYQRFEVAYSDDLTTISQENKKTHKHNRKTS